MELDVTAVGRRLREVREAAGVSVSDVVAATGISQPTYWRIENGDRVLKGDELVMLADLLRVRAATITGMPQLRERARYAARTDGSQTPMATMRERLFAYLELDAYLTDQAVPTA